MNQSLIAPAPLVGQEQFYEEEMVVRRTPGEKRPGGSGRDNVPKDRGELSSEFFLPTDGTLLRTNRDSCTALASDFPCGTG